MNHSPATSLIRASLGLSLVMGAANAANIFFQMAMCRMLVPIDYGVLMAMVGIINMLNVPAETLRVVMAFFGARHTREHGGQHGLVAGMYHQVLMRLLFGALLAAGGIALLTPWLVRLFRLEGPGPLLAAALVGLITLVMTTFQGVLQGTNRFGWYGLSMNLWFWGRLLAAIALVHLGFRATGALGGMALGALLGVALPRWILHQQLFSRREHIDPRRLRALYRYTLKALAAYAVFMALANIDVIFAKRLFTPLAAGHFSQIAMLAHLLWLTPFPIVMAMLPKAVACRRQGLSPRPLLWKALAMSGLTAAATALVIWLARELLNHALFDGDGALFELLPLYLVAMWPLAIVLVFLNYDLARNRTRQLWPALAGAIILPAIWIIRHDSPAFLLKSLAAVNWLIIAAQFTIAAFSKHAAVLTLADPHANHA